MANSSNKIVVPAARDAMDRFKMEAASDVGVTLKQGYNGDISARQAGSIGGQMVKKKCPTRKTGGDDPTGQMDSNNCPDRSATPDSTGHMTRNNCPTRTLSFRRPSRISDGHEIDVNYIFSICV